MSASNDSLQQLHDIKTMMERSSRFISLSGWSGISAGLCALLGAFFAHQRITLYYDVEYGTSTCIPSNLFFSLLIIAISVLISALVLALLFTILKSKKMNIPIWGSSSKRLLWNTSLPIFVGGIFILKMIASHQYDFVSAACLIFYGLGLVNGSKYTLGEVRYLGYAELALGILNLFFFKQGLLFWTLGFGICHIIYGIGMWWTYERNEVEAI